MQIKNISKKKDKPTKANDKQLQAITKGNHCQQMFFSGPFPSVFLGGGGHL